MVNEDTLKIYKEGFKDGFDAGYEKGLRDGKHPMQVVPSRPISNVCSKCGIDFNGKAFGYVCYNNGCPTFTRVTSQVSTMMGATGAVGAVGSVDVPGANGGFDPMYNSPPEYLKK